MKRKIKEELQKIKAIKGFRKRVGYVWDYYKIPILTAAAAVVFAAALIHALTGYVAPRLVVYELNNDSGSGPILTFNQAFADENAFQNKQLRFEGVTVKVTESSAQDAGYGDVANAMKIVGNAAANTLDILIADPETFSWYAENGMFLDLKEVLPALADSPCAFQTELSESGKTQTAGLRLTGSVLGSNRYYCGALIGIVASGSHTQAAVAYIKALFAHQG